MTAHALVVDLIRQEHQTLRHVVDLLCRSLRDIAAGYSAADVALLAASLCYLDDFARRQHHPREDEHLFGPLRRHGRATAAAIAELEAEHVLDAELVAGLHSALVHLLAGADKAPEVFVTRAEAYAALLKAHMEKEELFLEKSAACLSADEWRAIRDALSVRDDPLSLGPRVPREFRVLYAQIQNSLPRKLRYADVDHQRP